MNKSVLFIYPHISHQLPIIQLTQRLSNDTKIYCFCPEHFIGSLGNRNIEYISMIGYKDANTEYSGTGFFEKIRQYKSQINDLYMQSLIIVNKYEGIMNEIAPRYIISDNMCIYARMFAEKMRIPYIYTHADYFFTIANRMDYLQSECERSGIHGQQIERIKSFFQVHGNGKNILEYFYSDYLNICFVPSSFHPDHKVNPKRFIFAGCDRNAMQFEIKPVDGIYVFFEDIDNRLLQCFIFPLIQYCNEHAINLTITTAPCSIPEDTPTYQYLPEFSLEAIQQAKFFVQSGDLSFVREAILYHTIPICIPVHFDHLITATKLQEYGAGIYIHDKFETQIFDWSAVFEPSNIEALEGKIRDLNSEFTRIDTYSYISSCIEEVLQELE